MESSLLPRLSEVTGWILNNLNYRKDTTTKFYLEVKEKSILLATFFRYNGYDNDWMIWVDREVSPEDLSSSVIGKIEDGHYFFSWEDNRWRSVGDFSSNRYFYQNFLNSRREKIEEVIRLILKGQYRKAFCPATHSLVKNFGVYLKKDVILEDNWTNPKVYLPLMDVKEKPLRTVAYYPIFDFLYEKFKNCFICGVNQPILFTYSSNIVLVKKDIGAYLFPPIWADEYFKLKINFHQKSVVQINKG